MSSNVDIVRGGYEAYSRGDLPAVLAVFDPNIEWYTPEEVPGGGTCHSPDEVAHFFASLGVHFDELTVAPQEYLDAGDRVIVVGSHRGRVHDRPFEIGFAHVWTMREGRATKFREYNDSGKLLPLFAAPAAAV